MFLNNLTAGKDRHFFKKRQTNKMKKLKIIVRIIIALIVIMWISQVIMITYMGYHITAVAYTLIIWGGLMVLCQFVDRSMSELERIVNQYNEERKGFL